MGWLLPVHTMTCTWTGQVYWFYFKVGVTANTLTIMTSLIKILLVHIEIPDDIPTTPWYMYLWGDNYLFVFFSFSPFSLAFSLSCLSLTSLFFPIITSSQSHCHHQRLHPSTLQPLSPPFDSHCQHLFFASSLPSSFSSTFSSSLASSSGWIFSSRHGGIRCSVFLPDQDLEP